MEPTLPVRRWRAADRPSLVHHANDREVWRWLRDSFPHPYTDVDATAWLEFATHQSPAVNFAIEVDGEAVGGIGLVVGNDISRLSAEVGYWLGRDHWGQGLATKALRAITSYAFEALAVERVFATPFEGNEASFRVLEKAGFSLEGVHRRAAIKDGRILDLRCYSLIRPSAS